MWWLFKKASKKIGLTPGTLVHVGEQKVDRTVISVIDYDATTLREEADIAVDRCLAYRDPATVTWINVDGIHDVEIINKLGTAFELPALVLEDIVNTGHRPKLEQAGESLVIILKMLYKGDNGDLSAEQVSIGFGHRYVLTFQERPGDVFDPVRERIKRAVPRVRFMGTDYLAYALIDAVVDNYFIVLEYIGDRIEGLEAVLVAEPEPEHLQAIHELKRELVFLRQSVWPLREVIGGLERTESPLIQNSTRPYLRDLYEHVIQVIDTVETFREMVSGLLDIYLSSVSNRMNQVMKVLTIIATIFIPLSFLAGVYGMNFDTSASPFNLPELGMRFGYPLFWVIALVIGLGLLWWFRHKQWL